MRQSMTVTLFCLLTLFGCTRQKKVSTAVTFNSVPDEKLEQAVIDNIESKMNDDFSNEEMIVRDLPKWQKAVYVTWILEAEVSNGGFNQFYYNSSGQFADLSEEAFTSIGAVKFAQLVHQANLVYDSIKDDLAKYNDGSLESFSKSYESNPLNDLDTKFYELEKTEELSALRIKYIRDNIKNLETK